MPLAKGNEISSTKSSTESVEIKISSLKITENNSPNNSPKSSNSNSQKSQLREHANSDNSLHSQESQESQKSNNSSSSHHRWGIIKAAVKIATLVNYPVVHPIEVDDFEKEIELFEPIQRTESAIFDAMGMPRRHSSNSSANKRSYSKPVSSLGPSASACHEMFVDSVNRIQNEDKFLKLVKKGNAECIKELEKLCTEDPNFYYDDDDRRRLVNHVDKYNRCGLYIACQNGNLPLVKSLLDLRCNKFIAADIDVSSSSSSDDENRYNRNNERTSECSERSSSSSSSSDEEDSSDDESNIDDNETPLECAARWGYIRIVKAIVESFDDISDSRVYKMIRKAKQITASNNCKLFLRSCTRKYKKTNNSFRCTSKIN